VEGEGVAHGVQHVHAIQVEAVDRGADRDRACPDDQSVIAQLPLAALAGHGHLFARWVDRSGGVVQQQLDAGVFQVAGGAVGQVVPVGHVAGQVVGQPTDGEVGKGIGHDHGGLDRRVELAGTEGGRDPGVAPADHHQPHRNLPGSAVGWVVRRRPGPARRAVAGRGRRCRRGCGGPPRPAGRPGPGAPSPGSACPDRSGRHPHSPW
jgi:hypothetical protein